MQLTFGLVDYSTTGLKFLQNFATCAKFYCILWLYFTTIFYPDPTNVLKKILDPPNPWKNYNFILAVSSLIHLRKKRQLRFFCKNFKFSLALRGFATRTCCACKPNGPGTANEECIEHANCLRMKLALWGAGAVSNTGGHEPAAATKKQPPYTPSNEILHSVLGADPWISGKNLSGKRKI